MFAVLCAAILLLVFLLVGLMFVTKSKRAHSAEIRRLTAERKRSASKDPERRPIQQLPTDDPKSGNDNLAFEEDHTDGRPRRQPQQQQQPKSRKYENPPDIHFPLPPLHRPSSSSSATSDSSVYYNQRYRDEAMNIVHDQQRTENEPMFYKKNQPRPDKDTTDDGDRIYAIVAKGSSHDKQQQQHKKGKPKKRYLTENRVGSVDNTKVTTVEVISSPSHDSSEVTYAAASHNYEQMDTFNLREAQKIHQRRSQQLRQALYGGVDDFEIASSVINSPNEAINREILKALHKSSDHTSADSGSIGSFLSMASLKSFPK